MSDVSGGAALVLAVSLCVVLSSSATMALAQHSARAAKEPGPPADMVLLDCSAPHVALRVAASLAPDYPFAIWLAGDDAAVPATLEVLDNGYRLSGWSLAHSMVVGVTLTDDEQAFLSLTPNGGQTFSEPGECQGQARFMAFYGSVN